PFLAFTCLLSLPIFVFTALLFVLFPRVGLSLLLLSHSRPGRMVGFSDKVDLGGVGKLRTDPTIVLRVEVPEVASDPPPRLALYLKGTAFDRYDGRSWSRSQVPNRLPADQRGRAVRILRFPDPARDRKLRIELEPIDPPVVFLPIDAVALTLVTPVNAAPTQVPELFLGPEGGLSYRSLDDRGLRYEVSLATAEDAERFEALAPTEFSRYLALPSNLSPRISELSREWTRGLSEPLDLARALETRLRQNYRYDLDSPAGAAANPLEDFLFVSKRGHCEFYSTAMAVMLRSLGVPSRNVTGFIGGSYNRFARSYAVRQGDAHSWVEAYLPRRGWTRFDPTPPASSAPKSEMRGLAATLRDIVEAAAQRWNRHVINYDLKQQVGLLRSVRDEYRSVMQRAGWFGRLLQSPRWLVGAVLAVVGAYFLIRRLRRRTDKRAEVPAPRKAAELRARRIVEQYRALELALVARGIPRPSSTPPLAHARALQAAGHPLADEVLALTEQYVRVRFGGEAFEDAHRKRFSERVRAIKQARLEAKATAA
ncbi:MAG TPA: transglutaminaseTgpA domain-containing protein, partial [Polyangiaceae bacterium]|nr:transglutaminaseTgpA domain-containing protein [Polyangiaceae bacterium]